MTMVTKANKSSGLEMLHSPVAQRHSTLMSLKSAAPFTNYQITKEAYMLALTTSEWPKHF